MIKHLTLAITAATLLIGAANAQTLWCEVNTPQLKVCHKNLRTGVVRVINQELPNGLRKVIIGEGRDQFSEIWDPNKIFVYKPEYLCQCGDK